MRAPIGRFGVTCLLLAAPALASAQTVPAADGPRERAGSTAQPLPLPSFAEPRALPQAQADAAVDAVPLAGAVTIREVAVTSGDLGSGGVPARRWRPPDAGARGFALDHRRGERLDADWVRRQFTRNGFAGDGGTLADALALVQLINRAFITAGFVNSGLLVPEQPGLAGGVLELRLVAGRLVPAADGKEAVTVAWAGHGSAGLSAGYIRRRFPSSRRQPLSAVELERDFRLMAESPAVRTVDADLRPGARPGEASLHLVVEPERRAALYLAYANDRSPAVGGERLSAGGYVRNILASGDLLTAEVGLTRGVEDAQLGYSVPFISPRTMLTMRGSFNDAAVVDRPLLPLDIRAEDRAVEGGFVHRLVEEPLRPGASPGRWLPSQTLSTGLLLAYRHQRSFLFGEPFSFAPGSENGRSRYAALRFTGDYVMRDVDQVLAVSATGTVGLGGTRSDIPGVVNPHANFVVALAQANYARRLGPSGLELRARLTGQLASSILYSGERLSIGGQGSVRGYRENLFLVDRGAIGSVELAWNFKLTGRRGKSAAGWDSFTLAAFADAAAGGNKEPPEPARGFIASIGAGLTWAPSEALRLSLAWAEPLRDVPRSGTRNLQDRGIHFRLTVEPLRLLD